MSDPGSFQERVRPWLLECFGEMIAGDREERNHRFLEEALELVQACGCGRDEALQLVDYVFARPIGEPRQEVGGVMVTLAALCLANDLDLHEAGEAELARITVPETVAKIRAKQAAKPAMGPLPGVYPDRPCALADIGAERIRQIEAEGWTPEHDDLDDARSIALAASAYAEHAAKTDEAYAMGSAPACWPWAKRWWKPKDRRRDLVRAGALIVAEIERLDRADAKARAAHV